MTAIIRSSNGSSTWRYLVTYKETNSIITLYFCQNFTFLPFSLLNFLLMVHIQNMLRAIENMGIEMSFGIIFIGNGELSKKDYARYIEKHQLREVVQMKTILFIFLPFPLSNNSFVHSEQFQDMSELLCSFYYDFLPS